MYFYGKALKSTPAKPTAFQLLAAAERKIVPCLEAMEPRPTVEHRRVVDFRRDTASLYLVRNDLAGEGETTPGDPALWGFVQLESIRSKDRGNAFRATLYAPHIERTEQMLVVVPGWRSVGECARQLVSRLAGILELPAVEAPDEPLVHRASPKPQQQDSGSGISRRPRPAPASATGGPAIESDIPTAEEFQTLLQSVGVRQLSPDEEQQSQKPRRVPPANRDRALGSGLIQRQEEQQAAVQGGIDDILASMNVESSEQAADAAGPGDGGDSAVPLEASGGGDEDSTETAEDVPVSQEPETEAEEEEAAEPIPAEPEPASEVEEPAQEPAQEIEPEPEATAETETAEEEAEPAPEAEESAEPVDEAETESAEEEAAETAAEAEETTDADAPEAEAPGAAEEDTSAEDEKAA